jgi:N-carbamoylputrescine amidase
MKIAGIQFACLPEKEQNLEKAAKILNMAAGEEARIVCFQELFNLPWFPKERNTAVFGLAEPRDGETIRFMQERAKASETVVLVPFFERDGSSYFNSCAVIDADGRLAGVYRKVHVPDLPLWEEKFYFTPSMDGFPVFTTAYGKIAVQISWDNLYHEGARILALKGADMIFAPTACAFRSQSIWQTVISGNAISNGLFIMRVNRVGSEEAQDFYGMSFCVNPEGELIGGPTGRADSLLLADIDPAFSERVRREWPILRERRPELYTEVLGAYHD